MPSQLLFNAVIAASLYTLAGAGFSIAFRICRFFNFSFGLMCALGAYCTFAFNTWLRIPLIASAAMAILVTALTGLVIDILIFKRLRRGNRSPLVSMLASIGIYVVGQNLISLFFTDESRSVQSQRVAVGLPLLGGRVTPSQISIIVVSVSAVLCTSVWLRWSESGRNIRATASNRELATILGVNTDRVTGTTIVVSSAMGALSGILFALDRSIIPTMGMNILLFSIVVMIVGGQGSLGGLAIASALIAVAQNLTVLWVGAEWEEVVAFLMLIGFLLFRPQGLFGQVLRKSSA